MIRVLIAEDHHLVRQGIRALLEKSADIEVVGEAQDGQEAVEQARRLKPDVVVMDLAMPRLNGTQATEQIRAERLPTQVVILSMYSDETLVRQALRSGAKGYLLKRSVAEELPLAVRAARRGETFLSSTISDSILGSVLGQPAGTESASPFDRLSARERQVLKLVAEGQTNHAIAAIMHISVKTVEKHRSSVMAKLDVHDTAGMVRLALKHRLIFIEE
ncbi:MAG: response regulator transcription factor [Chloroflexi bacterium]|nr:response regulator transcription factor [Chloroflexota bacterium]